MAKAKTFRKITDGYVTQHYERGADGIARCVRQEFTAGDSFKFETDEPECDPVDPFEEYQPFDMIQPPTEMDGSSTWHHQDAICAFAKWLEDLDGDTLAEMLRQYLDLNVKYLGDSLYQLSND